MVIDKNMEALKTDKPKKDYAKIIREYVKRYELPFGYGTDVDYSYIDRLPKNDKYIKIVRSYNEERIYGFIMEVGVDKPIFSANILEASAEAYGKVATIVGATMETIDKYMFINGIE